jgi:hypothetical protein
VARAASSGQPRSVVAAGSPLPATIPRPRWSMFVPVVSTDLTATAAGIVEWYRTKHVGELASHCSTWASGCACSSWMRSRP